MPGGESKGPPRTAEKFFSFSPSVDGLCSFDHGLSSLPFPVGCPAQFRFVLPSNRKVCLIILSTAFFPSTHTHTHTHKNTSVGSFHHFAPFTESAAYVLSFFSL